MTWTAEQQHQFVGRLRALEAGFASLLDELPVRAVPHGMHAFDLLVIARDATHRAITLVWGKAPEMPTPGRETMTFPHAMLRGLKANWNSYGAPPIDERCIEKAFALWRQLDGEWQVVPCNDGGVQLEQHRDGFDIEITVNRAGLETPVTLSPSEERSSAKAFERSPRRVDTVPPGHFWRGVPESNRHQCRNCGRHYDEHHHTDEASLCQSQNRGDKQ